MTQPIDVPPCPKCDGPMWDNRTNKLNPRGPDYKCKDKECGGAAWLARAGEFACPKCGCSMWDNRTNKKNPKAPDFKCKNKHCTGVVWPPKEGQEAFAPKPAAPAPEPVDDLLIEVEDDDPF